MSDHVESRLGALDSVLDARPASESLADDLFAVVDALDAQPVLRRALTDPGTPDDTRRAVVHQLLDGKVGSDAVEVVAEASAVRWPGGRTFVAALERQAVRAELKRAAGAGQLADLEDELFRFGRVVEGNPALRAALSDRTASLEHRQELVSALLNGKAGESTIKLARRAVAARERTFGNTLSGYVTLAARERDRVIATVRAAQALTEEQTNRLQTVLSRQAGREVALQVIIDPSLLGGLRVELGDEVIEGTVAGRLGEARRLFG